MGYGNFISAVTFWFFLSMHRQLTVEEGGCADFSNIVRCSNRPWDYIYTELHMTFTSSSDTRTAPCLCSLCGMLCELLYHISQTVVRAACQDPNKLISGCCLTKYHLPSSLHTLYIVSWRQYITFKKAASPILSASNTKINNLSRWKGKCESIHLFISTDIFKLCNSHASLAKTIVQLNFCMVESISYMFSSSFRNTRINLITGKQQSMKANGLHKARHLFSFFCYVLHSHIYLYLRVLASMEPESFSNYKINSNSNIHHGISILREQFWLDRLTPLHGWVRLMSA